MLHALPCVDSHELGESRRRELDLPRSIAADLGQTALAAIRRGRYQGPGGEVDWRSDIAAAVAAKVSIPPDAPLPGPTASAAHPTAQVQVANETTLTAARRLMDAGAKPLALNFANGIQPGGGFLNGARAQEEALCRASALFATLEGDPMYAAHRQRPRPDSTDWAIYSPGVPVFRDDGGSELERPWLLDFITCAAPVATSIGQAEAGDLLQRRIHRVLDVARAYGYRSLVLGAWGCGAFGNDPRRTATDFRWALEHVFDGAFSDVVFAVTDWSDERRFLRPFCEVFSPQTR